MKREITTRDLLILLAYSSPWAQEAVSSYINTVVPTAAECEVALRPENSEMLDGMIAESGVDPELTIKAKNALMDLVRVRLMTLSAMPKGDQKPTLSDLARMIDVRKKPSSDKN